MRKIKLTEESKNNILENLLKRSPNSYGQFESAVNEILENVKKNKDAAIFDYTKRFDGADINADNIVVIEDGQIVEKGNHVELMKNDGIYASLVHTQELKA